MHKRTICSVATSDRTNGGVATSDRKGQYRSDKGNPHLGEVRRDGACPQYVSLSVEAVGVS